MAPRLLDELDGNRFHMGLIGSGAKKGPRPFVTTCPAVRCPVLVVMIWKKTQKHLTELGSCKQPRLGF